MSGIVGDRGGGGVWELNAKVPPHPRPRSDSEGEGEVEGSVGESRDGSRGRSSGSGSSLGLGNPWVDGGRREEGGGVIMTVRGIIRGGGGLAWCRWRFQVSVTLSRGGGGTLGGGLTIGTTATTRRGLEVGDGLRNEREVRATAARERGEG
jgi:hypothetical protein